MTITIKYDYSWILLLGISITVERGGWEEEEGGGFLFGAKQEGGGASCLGPNKKGVAPPSSSSPPPSVPGGGGGGFLFGPNKNPTHPFPIGPVSVIVENIGFGLGYMKQA